MGLLQPEPGLLIWMTIAFLIVFGLLARFGFPAIQKTLDERKKYIASSLEEAGDILRQQLEMLSKENVLSVLCTCVFYIADYNPKLLE